MIVICGLTPSEVGIDASVADVDAGGAVDVRSPSTTPWLGRASMRAVPSGWNAISLSSRGAKVVVAQRRAVAVVQLRQALDGSEHLARAGRPEQLGQVLEPALQARRVASERS